MWDLHGVKSKTRAGMDLKQVKSLRGRRGGWSPSAQSSDISPKALGNSPSASWRHFCSSSLTRGFFALWKLRPCGINKASSVPGLLHFWCIHRRKLYCLVFPDDYEVAAWCAMLTSSYMLISRISPVICKPPYKVRLAAFLKRKIILK